MKAIKLASIFAVTAVAAAVSTTTIAAEPVFKGSAGLYYTSYESGSDSASSDGEVNIIGDTGVVYFDLDMESNSVNGTDDDGNAKKYTDGGFDLDEIYVTQGAVQFGDFDGALSENAAFSAGVWEDNDGAKYPTDSDLAVRYSLSDELTIAVEAEEGTNKGNLAFSYISNSGGLQIGVAGVFHDADNAAVTLGAAAPLGSATLSAFVVTGSSEEADILNYGVGLDLPITESLSFAAQYYTLDGESSVGVDEVDQGIAELTAYYAVGDMTYYATYVSKEVDDSDYSVVGATVSF